MSLEYPEQPVRSSADATSGTITCMICNAAYAPGRSHEYLLQAPSVALESAFMSMSHFCFRCRRPACPGCWDAVHGVCGACVQEANLPFRLPTPSLSGVQLPPAALPAVKSQQERAVPAPLTCIRPGRFQRDTPLPLDAPTQALSIVRENSPRPPREEEPANPLTKQPAPIPRSPASDEDETRTPRRKASTLQHREAAQSKHDGTRIPTRKASAVRRIELALTLISVAVLCILIALIFVALLSQDADTLIEHVLHIDIRAEIAYLLQLIHLLH
jgi:hypothetical protein